MPDPNPLSDMQVSKRVARARAARGPMAAALELRARFMAVRWSCILVDAQTVQVARSWNRPYRTLTLAEAQQLLEELEVRR